MYIPKFIADRFDTTFNETCCRDHRVPEVCMGNCMKEWRSSDAPVNICEKWKEVIDQECVIAVTDKKSKF